MIRSRSPPGRRSSSEELEVIQRKHLERREAASHHVKRRGPVRPEGPRAPGVVRGKRAERKCCPRTRPSS
jgi:hypothetical protein